MKMNPDEQTRRKNWMIIGALEYLRDCPYCDGTGINEETKEKCSMCDGDGQMWLLECDE